MLKAVSRASFRGSSNTQAARAVKPCVRPVAIHHSTLPTIRQLRPDTGVSWAGPHSVYNDVGPVKTYFSAHLPGSVFSLTRNLFPATKVRARIVRWNRLSSTSHLFDPDPRQDHDYLFELPNALGRQDAQPRSRS